MKQTIFAFLSVFLFLSCQQNGKDANAISYDNVQQLESQYHTASMIPNLKSNDNKSSINGDQIIEKDEVWLESLITETPQEGRELALKMARKTIAAIQTDPEVRTKLRDDYAQDTRQLISSAEVVAIEFQTIAQANNYWRDKN